MLILHDHTAFRQPEYARFIRVCGSAKSRLVQSHSRTYPVCSISAPLAALAAPSTALCSVAPIRGRSPVWSLPADVHGRHMIHNPPVPTRPAVARGVAR